MLARKKPLLNKSLHGDQDRKQVAEEQGIYKIGYKRPPVHTQFKKCVSGNPRGVKKGTVFISEVYKRMLAMSLKDLNNYRAKSVAEEIAIRQVKDALGDNSEKQSLSAVKRNHESHRRAKASLTVANPAEGGAHNEQNATIGQKI